MDKITGFYLKSKDHERGLLVFSHCFSGNCQVIPASPEEMRHFHVGEYYSLRPTLATLEHERRPAWAA